MAKKEEAQSDKKVHDGPGRVKKEWDEKHAGKGKQSLHVPGSDTAVSITRMDVEGVKVSVWTSEDTSLPADYVIVNPPTAVFLDKDNIIEDPLGAIAYIINGVNK